jgi:hypothetical protein
MEDKWFVYREGDEVFFHRSWTGMCIYVAHLVQDADAWVLRDVTVNRQRRRDDLRSSAPTSATGRRSIGRRRSGTDVTSHPRTASVRTYS